MAMNSFVPADKASVILFLCFAIVMFLTCNWALRKVDQKLSFAFILLLVALVLIVQTGIVERNPFPLIPIIFATILGLSLWVSLSPSGLILAQQVPIWVLVGFQGFRFFLELILHHWAEIGTIPPTMTWTGQNYDIISGAVAILLAPFARRSLGAAWLANGIGFVLLLNVLRVVVLSSPLPFSWPLDRPLQLIFHMPYALIGPLFVAPALIVHLITFRRLFHERWTRNGTS